MVDAGDMTATTNRSPGKRGDWLRRSWHGNAWCRLVVSACLGMLACLAFFGASLVFMVASERNDPDCRNGVAGRGSDGRPTPDADLISLEPAEEELRLALDYGRGPERDAMTLAAGSEISGDIEVEVTDFTGSGGGVPKTRVIASARGARSTVLLEVCLQREALGSDDNGTFTGSVIFTDPRVIHLTLPVTITAQSRYIWGLAPLVVLFPFIALAITSSTGLRGTTENVKSWIAGVGAAGAVFSAQALANPTWGGPIAVFSLIASMHVAATGIAATVGTKPGSDTHRSHQTERDEAKPNAPGS